MLVTNHVLSGALIGSVTSRPSAAFALGVLSHAVLDSVPHWGVPRPVREMMHVAVPDGLVGSTAMAVITVCTPAARRAQVLAGMVGAAFPDLDKPSTVFFGFSPFPRAVDAFHQRIQRESPHRMPQEFLVGLAGATAMVVLTRRARCGTFDSVVGGPPDATPG